MRWFAKATLIIVIAFMMPGSLHFAEDGLHLFLEGHTSHDESHDHSESETENDTDEHGCSGPYHFCGCCASATFVSVGQPSLTVAPATVFASFDLLDTPAPSSHIEELFRPPTA